MAEKDAVTTEFPTDWQHAVILVAHPDDPEYGMAAAVARWTREGKRVDYVLASSGEAGIEGLDPAECGPLREDEQRRAGAQVGVTDIDFLGLPDSRLANDELTRSLVRRELEARRPDVAIVTYRGPEWAPGAPNQSDHIEFGNACVEAIAALPEDVRPRWVFENDPTYTHIVTVSREDVEAAVRSLAEHERYLSVLDPSTPVAEQARAVVDQSCRVDDEGRTYVGFALVEL